ncbi:Cytochrome-P450, partial [Teratosphaeria destructans]
RFLPADPAYGVPEHGFRPFELGPRNCIGQELALIEARVVLALTARRFEVRPAYGRLAELAGDGSYYARDEAWRVGRQDVDGEEAYAVLIGTAKPREGMPVVVREVGVTRE